MANETPDREVKSISRAFTIKFRNGDRPITDHLKEFFAQNLKIEGIEGI